MVNKQRDSNLFKTKDFFFNTELNRNPPAIFSSLGYHNLSLILLLSLLNRQTVNTQKLTNPINYHKRPSKIHHGRKYKISPKT